MARGSRTWINLLRSVGRVVTSASTRPRPAGEPPRPRSASDGPDGIPARYAPQRDGNADPGEVVWAWVPYEDDPTQGKDRPVLVLDVHQDTVIALPLTSKDHDRDAAQEARAGRLWMDIGSGGWDRSGRPSEVRLNRVLRLQADAVRREGAALDRQLFGDVVRAATPYLDGR